MRMKVLEVRDEATCIPALAIQMVADGPIEDRYLWRTGYPRGDSQPAIVLMHLSTQESHVDPYEWTGGRTMKAAHVWIIDHWDEISGGDVIDVRVTTLGLATKAATPEIWTGAV